jgi:hypothetical protein
MMSLSALSASSFALGRKPWPVGGNGIAGLADAEDCHFKCSREDIDSEQVSVSSVRLTYYHKAVIVAIPVTEGNMQVRNAERMGTGEGLIQDKVWAKERFNGEHARFKAP